MKVEIITIRGALTEIKIDGQTQFDYCDEKVDSVSGGADSYFLIHDAMQLAYNTGRNGEELQVSVVLGENQ